MERTEWPGSVPDAGSRESAAPDERLDRGRVEFQRPERGRGPKNYRRSDERVIEDVSERLMHSAHLDASDVTVSVRAALTAGCAMRLAISLVIAGLLAIAQPAFGATEQQPNSQQAKMKTCSADARTQELRGDERQAFMKVCLSGKQLTPQQQRMSDCSKTAAAQKLGGDARKKFMSECLKRQ